MSRKHHFVRTRAIKTWVWVFLALWCCGFMVKASFLGLFNESFEVAGFVGEISSWHGYKTFSHRKPQLYPLTGP